MLIQRVLLVVTALCWSFHAANGDTKPEKLTSFRPISQAEYEAILSLTDGETVVSEGRLINGGLAALAGLTTGWVTSLRFPNIFGSFIPAQKTPNASYPLCVIRTEENPESQHHHEYHGYHEHHNRQGRSDDNESNESSEEDYHHYVQQQLHHHEDHSHEDHSGEHISSIEMPWNTNKLAPVVNCIVVLREDEKHGDDYHDTTTKRPKRKRRKHRPHPALLPVAAPTQYAHQHQAPPPPSPSVRYPYSAAQSPYSPYGSYNNPWYWQTPYYNPYSSEPTTFTAIYPPAYPDIYAANNPGPNTRSYPGAYSGSFAPSPASDTPGPYYNAPPGAYSDPPPSAYPSDSYNPQPSSYTSHYSIQGGAINRKSPSQSSEPSYNYGPPPNGGSFAAVDQERYTKYHDERIRKNHKISTKAKKSASASKMPTTNKKQKPKRTDKPRPSNDHVNSESAPTNVPIRGRHSKVKRDESGIQTRSYAKIASYSESGYQPTLYPQYTYQSSYPKVSYNHALPYPAPVYVRNSIEQPSAAPNPKQYRAHATGAENEGYMSEHMQARKQVEGYMT
ncbi:uncharacterized protein LOC105225482 [Bactrocera dorsalis]|uniref:Uncharacterized protein LOC105225482 n=1 Tax=Bactrocera dorsalis TaxID=27457 RepID=A0A6I9V1I5_BACDO|nr:uncharacterized protein LOC105225482 [Bactrocera dorsalis]